MSYAGKVEYTHRIAAMVFLDYDPASGFIVMHLCDNPSCFNPAHLMLGSQKQNMSDAAARGRMGGGKKLTTTQAAEIKYLLREGSTQRELATRYGVSTTAIGQIYRGQTWKDVSAAAQATDTGLDAETQTPAETVLS